MNASSDCMELSCELAGGRLNDISSSSGSIGPLNGALCVLSEHCHAALGL